MDEAPRPTIKGIFVKSHIRALERERGSDGVIELQKRFGKPINYSNSDDVPVADEVLILEHIVDITSPVQLAREERELEAGRLHFRNFSTTPLWTLTEQIFGTKLKFLLMQSSKIAGYVFQDVHFASEDLGERSVRITMFNNDYPIEHFQGFFEQWLQSAGHKGKIAATAHTRGRYEYTISWEE
jgi:uncharacterized protein (TIGR02265 family)